MTEIIPGLQGDAPANSRKGVPFVGGKYVSLVFHIFILSNFVVSSFDCKVLWYNFHLAVTFIISLHILVHI